MDNVLLCQCGCGEAVTIFRGKPRKYRRGHWNRGERHCNYKGGISISTKGYKSIYKPTHNRADRYGYVREHILVVENVLGKPLPEKAVIHHIDENKLNNDKSNLILCENDQFHHLLHLRKRALAECGHASWRKCWICKKWDDPKNLYIATGHPTYHYICKAKYRKNSG